jgi:hypothetical protein
MSVGPLDSINWDEQNEAHVAENGLTTDEVDEVLRNKDSTRSVSKTSGLPVTFGWTTTGRHIMVVWDEVNRDPRAIRPVTAYDVPPPRKRKT